jgi:uncharacterized protein (TIGR00730 family)
MSHSKGPIVTVYGSSSPAENSLDYEQARALGRLLAQQGYVVATGGYTGTMEGASRGAKEAGGRVIGVTTSLFDKTRPSANPYVDEEIKLPTLFQRLHYLVTLADAWVALPGGIGTLSEVALTWSLMQVGEMPHGPFVLVGDMWRKTIGEFSSDAHVKPQFRELIKYAENVEQVLPLIRNP